MLILCDPMDCSPPGSSVHGISQARILEWVAIPFYRGSSQPRDWTWVSCIAGRFFTIWAATRQAQPGLGSHFSHHSLNISGFSTSYYQRVTSLQIINIFINLYRMFLPLCVLFVATDLLSFFFFFFNWLLWRNTNIYSIYLFSLRAPFLGSAGMNLHFLASQGSLTPLHAIIGLQLSVLVYPWWCAAVEWNSRNPPDTCDLILCWNDMESLRIMDSFLVCSNRSVSMEAFYHCMPETVLSAGVMKWWCHRNRGHGTRCLMQGPRGRLTAGIQLHITLAMISWALFPQALPEWNASACSGKYSLQTFLFTDSGQQKMDEGASQ